MNPGDWAEDFPIQHQPRVAKRSERNPSRHPNCFLLGGLQNP